MRWSKLSSGARSFVISEAVKGGRTTALLIPCPWSGDEHDPVPRSYWAWIWLYVTTRRLRHRVGLHDWHQYNAELEMLRCTWCGKGLRLR